MEEYVEFPLTGSIEPDKIEFGYTMSSLKWIYTYPNGYCASIVLLDNGFFSVAAYLKESDTISHRFVDEHGSSEDDIRFDQVAEILDEIARYPEVIR